MSLQFVEPHPDPHVNVLLYGAAKTGKSCGAASAPGPILYLNADSPNALSMARRMFPDTIHEVRAEGLQTVVDVSEELLERPDEFKTIVVDPVGELYRVILESLSGRALSPHINLYKDTQTHLERFMRFLCELPINVVFVAHEFAEKDDEAGNFERLPATGTKNPALGAKLMAMVDIFGYTGVVAGEGDAPPKYLAQLINGGGRRGGDRFGVLGPDREINVSEWIELAAATTATKVAEE